jgi:hypothetical protein
MPRLALIIIIFCLPLMIWPGCSPNKSEVSENSPVIDTIIIDPTFILPGGEVQLTAVASDPDNRPLTYHWETYPRAGLFSDTLSSTTTFIVSNRLESGMSVKITVEVNNGEITASKDRWIVIDSGNTISGHVYYPKSKIPVSDVIVSAFTRIDTTDENGFYALKNIPNGDYLLKASRNEFSNYETSLSLAGSTTEDIYLDGDSLIADLSGIIKTVEDWPIEGARISILNPDGSYSQISALTDSNGEYNLSGVPLGARDVTIEGSAQCQYKVLPETYNITFREKNSHLDAVAKISRVVFESNGVSAISQWDTTAGSSFGVWVSDIGNDCLSFNFCQSAQYGKLTTKNIIAIPSDVGAVYWAVDADLSEAATVANFIIYGTNYWVGSYGSGTNHITIDEPVDIDLLYLRGSTFKIELYAFAQKPGVCGFVRLNRFSIYIFR